MNRRRLLTILVATAAGAAAGALMSWLLRCGTSCQIGTKMDMTVIGFALVGAFSAYSATKQH